MVSLCSAPVSCMRRTSSDCDVVRMLLKNGYRHVYMSRKFALKHGFIPTDAAPGHYGYSGLVKCVHIACF